MPVAAAVWGRLPACIHVSGRLPYASSVSPTHPKNFSVIGLDDPTLGSSGAVAGAAYGRVVTGSLWPAETALAESSVAVTRRVLLWCSLTARSSQCWHACDEAYIMPG